uniref:Uncharacterized protein C12orf45 n=1 Tax=Anthurium amnicola TaxID=1678845 RepID=A0A1D1ZH12_9ARAE
MEGEMEGRVVSKELLEFEKSKPSLLESNFLVHKEEKEDDTGGTNIKRKEKKLDDKHGKEEVNQHITATVPTSQVLDKVRDFLGVIAEANEKLQLNAQGNSLSDYDIEVLSGKETEYIEMDLLLGVADLQTPEAVSVAEAAIGGSQQYLSLVGESIPSDSEENDDIATDTSLSLGKVPKPDLGDSNNASRRRKRPKITVLN